MPSRRGSVPMRTTFSDEMRVSALKSTASYTRGHTAREIYAHKPQFSKQKSSNAEGGVAYGVHCVGQQALCEVIRRHTAVHQIGKHCQQLLQPSPQQSTSATYSATTTTTTTTKTNSDRANKRTYLGADCVSNGFVCAPQPLNARNAVCDVAALCRCELAQPLRCLGLGTHQNICTDRPTYIYAH